MIKRPVLKLVVDIIRYSDINVNKPSKNITHTIFTANTDYVLYVFNDLKQIV